MTRPKWLRCKAGEVPIHEKFLPELLERHRGHNLTFSDDLGAAVRASEAIFIAVGTPPTEQGEADLSYVESVARSISGAINELQGGGGKKYRPGLHQRLGAQDHVAQRGRSGLL